MGLTVADMLCVITSLSRHDFYKSMTTHNDHRVWQDVYYGTCPTGQLASPHAPVRTKKPCACLSSADARFG